MAEQEPPPSADLDDQALAEALHTRSATVRDVAYGEGLQYFLGRCDARLEIFPGIGVTRLTGSDVRVELFGGAPPHVSDSGVEFSRTSPGEDASLTVVPGGGIVFSLVVDGERTPDGVTDPEESPPVPSPSPPLVRAPETAQKLRSDADGTSVPLPPVRTSTIPSAAREPASAPTAAEAARSQSPAAAETEPERIALTGRLGRDPSFSHHQDRLAGRPLPARRPPRGRAHRLAHRCSLRSSRRAAAARLAAGELTQGREVDVVGYRHVNTRPGKDGTLRQVQEVYAVAVKKR